MTHRYRLILFDLDGTLVDSQANILQAMTGAFAALGLSPPPAGAMRAVIGLKLELAMARLLPESGDQAGARRLAEAYRQASAALRARPDHREHLFPGAREILARLDRPPVLLGIATGKGRRALMASLEQHGLGQHFATLQSVDEGPGKPHPEMLHRALAEVAVAPSETVMIGDTSFDMEMARNAGVRGIGVAWGNHEAAQLRASGADPVIATFSELPPCLASPGGA